MNTSANAATTDTSVVSQTSGSTDATAASSAKVAETPLTVDDLAKATAAAQTAAPGATIDRTETEGDGSAAYEVHVTRADGTHATVKLNSDFSMTSSKKARPEAEATVARIRPTASPRLR